MKGAPLHVLPPRIQSLLEHPRIVRWAALLAVLCALPSIVTGLQVDDLFHQANLRRLPPFGQFAKSPLELFTFFDGDPARNDALVREGIFAWWTGPHLRMAFCRPLSAATHWLDHTLWPGAPWLMHVHSYLWAALAVMVAGAFYRRLIETQWVVGLAVVMFAVSDAHAIPYSWIANRNALIAFVLGAATLHAHRSRSWLAIPCFALALAAGESALGTLAFLVAHALCLEERGARVRRLLVYLPVVAVWALLYRHFGFGTSGSGLYFDPGRDPLQFLAAAFVRFPMLLAATVFAAPIDLAFWMPRGALIAVVIASWLLVLGIAWWVLPVVRARRSARFFALATVLCVLPSCATIPSGRLLMFATFGAMGLFSEAIAYGAARPARAMSSMRLYVSPLLLVAGNFAVPTGGVLIDRFSAAIPDDPALQQQELILVTSFDAAGTGYVTLKRKLEGKPIPLHTHVMALGLQEVSVTRSDERTLVVRPRDGFLADRFSSLFRGEPFTLGMRVRWVHATIEVTELTADGRAAAARFTFDERLESSRYRWMTFAGKALVPFALPAIGATVTVPPGALL